MNTGARYIVVTGGVVSGLGKGIIGASIGLILKSSGISVEALKMDPYLNVDPGTMSPYEHGEVYVLGDGAETDLDLGHYERFLQTHLTKRSTMSAGRIYQSILDQEREGVFLGHTVQLIPHITDYIKKIYSGTESDVKVIEIGGSTGDMEAEVFLEGLRQFRRDHPGKVLHIHLGYVPFLKVSGEYKSKPLQNSLRELLRLGIQPDIIAARYEPDHGDLPLGLLEKIALFGNLNQDRVIPCPDMSSIYSVPIHLLENTKISEVLAEFMDRDLHIKLPRFFHDIQKPKEIKVKVALVSKYTKLSDAYLSVIESVKIAAAANNVDCVVTILDADDDALITELKTYDAVIVPGGFGSRGMEGKIKAIEYVRMHKVPYFGICLGMQLAVVEFARNACGIPRAVSREMENTSPDSDFIIDFIPEQLKITQKGGTMRLGDYRCDIQPETKIASLFGVSQTIERHRHRLEVQNQYVKQLEDRGMLISGRFTGNIGDNPEDYLVEMIELNPEMHPYFVGTQSHPEFLSRPDKPHPLFDGLIKAAIETKKTQ
ncbi:MAG: CTP synthase [bacterium]